MDGNIDVFKGRARSEIRRANLDGSNIETLVTTRFPTDDDGLWYICDIVLDLDWG